MLATVSQGKRLPNPLSMGLCLPAACKDSDLNSFKPYLVPIINQELKSAFKDVEGLGLADLILENDDINFETKTRLVFRYGEKEEIVKNKLYERDLVLEFEKKVVYEH